MPRILSLDGGGVRGLSSLMILQELMEEIGHDAEVVPKPCEYFDLIGGTSTGGLIAIMLGLLEMVDVAMLPLLISRVWKNALIHIWSSRSKYLKSITF